MPPATLPGTASPSTRAALESVALKSLVRLAYAATHERGDIQVERKVDPRNRRLRLEAWAREVEPDLDGRIPPGARADAEMLALEMGGWLEVRPDTPGRKIVFRIDVPGR